MARSFALLSQPTRLRFAAWLRREHVAARLAVVLTVAATLSGTATYVVLSGWFRFGADIDLVLGLLYLDIILLLLLGALVARRLAQLVVARWQNLAGSRLHARLVGLFSLVAVAPAIVVAVFSVGFLHYGLEAWFSERISNALTNSLNVARSYLEEHKEVIRADALAMAADLNRDGPTLLATPAMFQRLLDAQAALRSLTEAIVFQSNGQVIARTGLSFGLELETLSPQTLEQAAYGDVVVLTSDTEDRVRALVRLDNFVDAYLFVGRFVDARVLDYMDRTREVVDEYRSLQVRRSGIQVTFAVIFGVVALLLLLAAVGVGLGFANRLATPIVRLIAAADRVRAGDLSVAVPVDEEGHEIDRLSRAFNRMTAQLSSQRAELIRANNQLDERRRFTEAVIADVSAGVIGLDGQGRITLPNRSAADLIGCQPDDLLDRPLIAVIPEVAGLLAGAATTFERTAEAQIELHRQDGIHTLLVRASAQTDEAGAITGFVVTFDDITELLAAQRKAAWAEIARRIAHEIKNPLTPIRLSAERLKRKYLPQIRLEPEAFIASADTIVSQVDNIGRLINEFSAFARMPAPVFGRESAAALIRQAVHLQQGARPEIRFETRLPAHDVQLYCDGRQVAQALTNLLQNAVQSVIERKPGDPREGARGWVLVTLSETGDHAVIEVEDNGGGLPEPMDRLTDPYVTTRGGGTGLGLAIVKKIMEEHGGTVSLGNRAVGGARVGLVFPALRALDKAAAE
jgi:two-component system, NtrC family, nitrogen regulation sensor histidine kinase NtrY